MSRILRIGWILVAGCATSLGAAEPSRFLDVAALLEQRCVRCHSDTKAQGGLSLTSREALLKGGDSGPAIVPGNPAGSVLLQQIMGPDPAMPAEGAALTADEVARVRDWIEHSAEWSPGVVLRERSADPKNWWAFQPLRPQAVPEVRDAGWPRGAIDSFILAPLERQQLHPSAAADRRTLIRRLTMDLHGLPPVPDDVEEFLADPAPDAFERLLDRLLASPHYGVRWARHWLDIVHYADTHGFERDQRRDHAWRYRDWVIAALNADRPYTQFVEDQLAGDVLRPDDPDAVIATGYLAAGPWDFVGQAETPSPVLKRLARADDLDDLVTQVMTSLCGVTIHCARCHDHKLDPISQREYYSLWAVFAGVKRGDRDVSPREVEALAARRQALNQELQKVRRDYARRLGRHVDLADIVGGGDGFGSGQRGHGVDPISGNVQTAPRGFLNDARPNVFAPSPLPFIDGVVIPDLSPEGTPISTTGLKIPKVPRTSGQVWDAIRNGPVHSQFSTVLDGTDYGKEDHTLLSLHANAAITFDLAAIRTAGAPEELKFAATAGYFGQTATRGASFHVYVDGIQKAQRMNLGRSDGAVSVEVPLPAAARFLTLMATDGGNGISHDQIGFADPWLVGTTPDSTSEDDRRELERLAERRIQLEQALTQLPAAARVYAVVPESPPSIQVLTRGDPEQPADVVTPAALSCLTQLAPELGTHAATDADRRIAFARWINSEENPLPARVLVNRLWHHHFGIGLVETPSDLGVGGSLPSHPELLDWLARELQRSGGSLKSLHRRLCSSAVYRQVSTAHDPAQAEAARRDSANRGLWRMNPRRLDAESVRDAVLIASGCLNDQMTGPGYRDFEYQEEYAPVYRYVCADSAPLWRRTIYRFAVRTTTHPFLTTLDCPSPANLAPVRTTTTTALQSLTLLNNEFMIRQSRHFARRLESSGGDDVTRIEQAFRLAYGRRPTPDENQVASGLVRAGGLDALCRVLLNSNEFVYYD